MNCVAVTNPEGCLFLSTVLPQRIVPGEPQWPQYLALGLTFAAIDFIVMLGYACAGALLALAGSLAFYRRGA